jgi:hypothetical protein
MSEKMINPIAYINVEERKLEWAEPIFWHTPTVAKMDKVPLYLVEEQNIDYKKEWLQAKKQSDIYESWWIKYRDMAVKLDKELRQQQAENELLESKRMIAYNIGYEDGRKAQENE